MKNLNEMNKAELEAIIQLAIGRIFRLGSRKTQIGDIEQYEKCKEIIIKANELLKN